MFGRAPKKKFSFNGPHHGRSMPRQSNIGDIMMHDVNIEEKTKAKCQSLGLSLFSSI